MLRPTGFTCFHGGLSKKVIFYFPSLAAKVLVSRADPKCYTDAQKKMFLLVSD